MLHTFFVAFDVSWPSVLLDVFLFFPLLTLDLENVEVVRSIVSYLFRYSDAVKTIDPTPLILYSIFQLQMTPSIFDS